MSKISQICRKTVKNRRKCQKPGKKQSKMSKNLEENIKKFEKPGKTFKNVEKYG